MNDELKETLRHRALAWIAGISMACALASIAIALALNQSDSETTCEGVQSLKGALVRILKESRPVDPNTGEPVIKGTPEQERQRRHFIQVINDVDCPD